MQRRSFLIKSTIAIGGISLMTNDIYADTDILGFNSLKRLKMGDKVGVITPASALKAEDFDVALNNIRSLGLIPVPATYANRKYGFLGGTDYQRLSDLHEVFENRELKGVVCARGGYGSARLLNNIDYDLIRNNPKVLIGFSDITALLNAIYQKTGLICFHGPVGASSFTDFTRNEFKRIVMDGDVLSLKSSSGYLINGGITTGKLVGGNLSLITATAGTSDEINFNNKIVLIEEVGESPYRIDRMLTQLINTGKFNKANGVIFGKFEGCDIDANNPVEKEEFSLEQVLKERCRKLDMPVYYGFDFGHVNDNATLPIGLKVKFNADNGSLEGLRPAVK